MFRYVTVRLLIVLLFFSLPHTDTTTFHGTWWSTSRAAWKDGICARICGTIFSTDLLTPARQTFRGSDRDYSGPRWAPGVLDAWLFWWMGLQSDCTERFSDVCMLNSLLYTPSRSLRSSSDTCMLKLQRFSRKTHGFRTFSHFGPHSEHRFPAPSSLKEGCRKPVLGVWLRPSHLEHSPPRLQALSLLSKANSRHFRSQNISVGQHCHSPLSVCTTLYLNPFWCVHYVLAFVKLRITYSISMCSCVFYVCSAIYIFPSLLLESWWRSCSLMSAFGRSSKQQINPACASKCWSWTL